MSEKQAIRPENSPEFRGMQTYIINRACTRLNNIEAKYTKSAKDNDYAALGQQDDIYADALEYVIDWIHAGMMGVTVEDDVTALFFNAKTLALSEIDWSLIPVAIRFAAKSKRDSGDPGTEEVAQGLETLAALVDPQNRITL